MGEKKRDLYFYPYICRQGYIRDLEYSNLKERNLRKDNVRVHYRVRVSTTGYL